MKYAALAFASVVFWLASPLAAHDGHHHPHHHSHSHADDPVDSWVPNVPASDTDATPVSTRPDPKRATTGSGEYTFRLRPLELPAPMQKHLVKAHGGFAPDPESRGGDGSTYFALKGVGLLRLTPDLSSIEVIGGNPAFTNVNVHNTCVIRGETDTYLALPSDEAQRAFLTTTRGHLLRTFPNPYGEGKGAFRVCDLEYVDGLLYAPNGYADNVVFATNPFIGSDADPFVGTWETLRFGGKGKEHGKFGTAHGITRVPDTNVFTIADRANSRVESYTKAGRYIGGIELPAGSLPCDIDYHDDVAVVGCLRGPKGATPAPIYILERGNLVAELNVGRDLGLEGFTHIHNAAFRVIRRDDGREQLHVLVYAWNPGNFAILEQVID